MLLEQLRKKQYKCLKNVLKFITAAEFNYESVATKLLWNKKI